MAFMDFMVAKGYSSAGSISPWKSAAKQVFSTVEGEDFAQADARSFDIGEYMTRFENMSLGKYSSESLRAYRSRFRRAVEAYRSYLADPNWRPETPRAARSNGDASKAATRRTSSASRESVPAPMPSPSSSLIAYPFPLKSGQMAQLNLPTQLHREDADRLTHFIRALVVEQPFQLNPGTPEGES